MSCHDEPHGLNRINRVNRAVKVSVESFIRRLKIRPHLSGAENPPLPFPERPDELLESIRHDPCVLVQEIHEIISLRKSVFETNIIRLGET